MKKVLFVLQGLGMGGVSSVIMAYYNQLYNEIIADFVVISKRENTNPDVISLIESRGGNVFFIPSFVRHPLAYCKELHKIIVNGKYDIVHDNDKYFGVLSLYSAKQEKVKIRISHVHNTVAKSEKKLLHRVLITVLSYFTIKTATNLMACSVQAGKSMFGDRSFTVLNNAIDPHKYRFDLEIRNDLRRKYCLEDKFVMMIVARNDNLKRFDFAFRIFKELKKRKDNAVLCIIGFEESDLIERDRVAFDVLSQIEKKDVVFLGQRYDVNILLNMADCFLLTSQHEGFGISIVEAQANGLPCFVSDSIPESVKVTDLVTFLPVLDCPDRWADNIAQEKQISRNAYEELVKESAYSIESATDILRNEYCI